MENVSFSRSEESGLSHLRPTDLLIYSVGISTGGVAEMRMVRDSPARQVVATTIDEKGLAFARDLIAKEGLDRQIEAKNEDVAQKLPYPDNHFDYVYARLVLHYLSKQQLPLALGELNRVLKPGGNIFVVVRSVDCEDAKKPNATFDSETGLTTCVGDKYSYSRYFHSEQSISGFMQQAGFKVGKVAKYDEQLYKDFMRTQISDHLDNVIEILAQKPNG